MRYVRHMNTRLDYIAILEHKNIVQDYAHGHNDDDETKLDWDVSHVIRSKEHGTRRISTCVCNNLKASSN